jgi:hypothetical protein
MPRIRDPDADQTGNEFFYEDDDGERGDDVLHNHIIFPVDYPNSFTINEDIMAPIRAKNRAKADIERRNKKRR